MSGPLGRGRGREWSEAGGARRGGVTEVGRAPQASVSSQGFLLGAEVAT